MSAVGRTDVEGSNSTPCVCDWSRSRDTPGDCDSSLLYRTLRTPVTPRPPREPASRPHRTSQGEGVDSTGRSPPEGRGRTVGQDDYFHPPLTLSDLDSPGDPSGCSPGSPFVRLSPSTPGTRDGVPVRRVEPRGRAPRPSSTL